MLPVFICCSKNAEFDNLLINQDEDITAGTRALSLLFEDDFNQQNGLPDTSKWTLCPKDSPDWARYLSESYDQAYVENGNLVLVAEKVNGEYKTGGVQTLGKFDFQYGTVEVRARFTKTAKGGWPAIWMMPSVPKYAGGWPECGEIDIMEQLNNDLIVHHTIHSHYKNTLNLYIPIPSMVSLYRREQYNTYAVKWTPDYIAFWVNGVQRLKYPNWKLFNEAKMKQWPFDAPFYIILNYALGGEGTWPGAIKDDELPAKMEIDWIRVCQ